MTLQNKNVAITGAYGGLGSSLATSYYNKGCNLFLMGANTKKLTELKKDFRFKIDLKKLRAAYKKDENL